MRDRLDWLDTDQVVFILPTGPESPLLTNEADLAVLARHADALRIQLGFVSQEVKLRQTAGSMGFPTFQTVDLAETSFREWRRHRVRPDGLGVRPADLPAVFEDAADKRQKKLEAQQQRPWRYWSRQIIVLSSAIIGAILLGAGVLFYAPSATITLTPSREKITIKKEITADFNSLDESAGNGSGTVGSRQITMIAKWQSDLVPTGQAELAANPARGKIVFANLNNEPVSIPAGLLISTAADQSPVISFRTSAAIDLPATTGATAEVDAVAVEVGPTGNLPAERLTIAEGDWNNIVQVRQPLPMTGGNIQPVPVVTEADRIALRTEVIQQLQSLAAGQIDAQLGSNEFLSVESLRINRLIEESWSQDVGGKSDRLALSVEAEISGVVIDFNEATDLVYTELVAGVRPGFSLTPDSFRFYKAGNTRQDEDGQITFDMVGEGTMTAVLKGEGVLETIAGKNEDEAAEILKQQLSLDQEPVFRIIPNWFGRLPNFASRIEIILVE